MQILLRHRLHALAALLALSIALPALARRVELTIHRDSTLNGSEVPSGTYALDLTEGRDTVTLYRGRKSVATAKCRVEELTTDIPGDTVVYRTGDDGRAVIAKILLRDARLAVWIE